MGSSSGEWWWELWWGVVVGNGYENGDGGEYRCEGLTEGCLWGRAACDDV